MSTEIPQFELDIFSDNWGEDKRKDLVFLARCAESSERYDDMCKCMKELVGIATSSSTELSVDERNLLSVAYKNVIGARRASWRTLNAESQESKSSDVLDKYKEQVVEELKEICKDILGILEGSLIKPDVINNIEVENEGEVTHSTVGEAQVFYLKMAGDYYRYFAEAVPNGDEAEKNTAKYYKQAFELSEKVLEPTHPIRLGLALNYSVCFYEILKDKKKACQLAKDAFDEAISKLDKLEENDYKDSTLIMQLLRDNLTLWTSTDEDGDESDKEDGGGD